MGREAIEIHSHLVNDLVVIRLESLMVHAEAGVAPAPKQASAILLMTTGVELARWSDQTIGFTVESTITAWS
jgi:uncharacterized protein YbcI